MCAITALLKTMAGINYFDKGLFRMLNWVPSRDYREELYCVVDSPRNCLYENPQVTELRQL